MWKNVWHTLFYVLRQGIFGFEKIGEQGEPGYRSEHVKPGDTRHTRIYDLLRAP
jgi:hypothetical protein